jgi:hypothetical protein
MDHLREGNRAFHEGWLGEERSNRRAVQALVARLFPAIGALLAKQSQAGGAVPGQRAALRICAEQSFEVYFRYSIEDGLARAAFLDVLRLKPEQLAGELRRLQTEKLRNGSTKLRRFLEMLRDEVVAGAEVNVSGVLGELCALGDTIVPGAARSFDVSDDFFLVIVIEKILEQLPANQRASALRAALPRAGVTTAARIVTMIGAQHGRHGGTVNSVDERTIPDESQLDGLEELARDRLGEALRAGTLWQSPRLSLLLLDWQRLAGEDEVRTALGKWALDDANLIKLLEDLVGPTLAGRRAIDMETASVLLDLDAVAERAPALLERQPQNSPAREALQALLKALSATDGRRRIEKAKVRILTGILREIEGTHWYPEGRKIRTEFASEQEIIDLLLTEKLIGQTSGDAIERYMLTLPALKMLLPHPLVAADLRACAILLTELEARFRQGEARHGETKVALDELLPALTEKQVDIDLPRARRAALIVQRTSSDASRALGVGFDNDGNVSSFVLTDAIFRLPKDEYEKRR